MKTGEMRDKITFIKKKSIDDTIVDLSDDNYEEYKTVWAKTEYFSSKEIYSSSAINVLDSLKFIIRYRNDVSCNMKISFSNCIYDIKGIRPLDGKKMYMLIVAEVIKHE